MAERLGRAFACGWLLLWGVLALAAYLPPRARPADAPGHEFSAGRAMAHVQAIAAEHHRSGTPAIRRVRQYIISQFRAFGLEPTVHQPVWLDGLDLAHPVNVVARLRGVTASPAFMLMAHHDSVPTGPGAADDAAGVAAILETARALTAGPRPRHDVIFAITDAEERGLIGARTLASEPWIAEVGAMVNFEARGVCGPSFLFETSVNNGWLVAELARIDLPIISSSLMFDVFRSLPFRTDFSAIRDRVPGFDVAFIDRFPHYHTCRDDPAHLSPHSLQHHGAYALGLARHFANLEYPGQRVASDVVFFNPIGGRLVWYPLPWQAVASAITLILAALGLAISLRLRVVSGVDLLLATVACGGALLSVVLTAAVQVLAAIAIHQHYALYASTWFAAAGLAFAVAVVVPQWRWWRGYLGDSALSVGALVWWLAAVAGLSVVWPMAAHAVQWPLLGATVGWWVAGAFSRPASAVFMPAVAIGATPALTMLLPMVPSLLQDITFLGLPALLLGLVMIGALVLPCGDLCASLLPVRGTRWALVVGAVLYATGLCSVGPDAARPAVNSLAHLTDLDSGHAWWVSRDEAIDEFTGQFLVAPSARFFPDFLFPDRVLAASAATLDVGGSQVAGIAVTTTASGGRRLCFEVVPASAVARIGLRVRSPAAVLGAWCAGLPVASAAFDWQRGFSLNWRVVPDRPASFVVDLGAEFPLEVQIVDWRYGLPDLVGLGFRPRPPWLIPVPNTVMRWSQFDTDTVVTRRTWQL